MHKKGPRFVIMYSIRFEDTKLYYAAMGFGATRTRYTKMGWDRVKSIDYSRTYKTPSAAKGEATKLGLTNYTIRPSKRYYPQVYIPQ